jgi:hypothetical protein
MRKLVSVIPAKAGIQLSFRMASARSWTPALAGVTGKARANP